MTPQEQHEHYDSEEEQGSMEITTDLQVHETDVHLSAFEKESKEITHDIIQKKINLIDTNIEHITDTDIATGFLCDTRYNTLSLKDLSQQQEYTSYVDSLLGSIVTLGSVESFIIETLQSPTTLSGNQFATRVRSHLRSPEDFFSLVTDSKYTTALSEQQKQLLKALNNNSVLAAESKKYALNALNTHIFTDSILYHIFTTYHQHLKAQAEGRLKTNAPGGNNANKTLGTILGIGLTMGIGGIIVSSLFGKKRSGKKRSTIRGLLLGVSGAGLLTYLLPQLIGKEKFNQRLSNADEKVSSFFKKDNTTTTPAYTENGQALGHEVRDPLTAAQENKENDELKEKSTFVGNEVNALRSTISYSQDVLGDATYESGDTGAIVHSLSSIGTVEYLLSEKQLFTQLSVANPTTFDNLRQTVDSATKKVLRGGIAAVIPDVPVLKNIETYLVGDKRKKLQNKEQIRPFLHEIFRKYHKVLLRIEQARQQLSSLDDDTVLQEFMKRPLISTAQPDALSLLQEKGIIEKISSNELLEIIKHNNKKLHNEQDTLELMMHDPTSIDTKKVQEICNEIIDDANDYGARVRYQRMLSGLSFFINNAEFERGEILKATGYNELAAGYTHIAEKISGKIQSGDTLTQKDLQELHETREKQVGLLNELLLFADFRTEIQQTGDTTFLFGGININPRYIPSALKVRKGDVLSAGSEIISGFRIAINESPLEGGLHVAGGYVAFDRLTFALHKPLLAANNAIKVPLLHNIVKLGGNVLYRISPTRHLLVRPITYYTSRNTGILLTKNIPLLGQYLYSGPDGAELLVKDMIRGKVTLGQASKIAPHLSSLPRGRNLASSPADFLIRITTQASGGTVILTPTEANLLATHRDSPGVRRFFTLQRQSIKFRKTGIAVNTTILTHLQAVTKELASFPSTALGIAENAALEKILLHCSDLSQIHKFSGKRSSIFRILRGSTTAGNTFYQTRGITADEFGQLLGRNLHRFSDMNDFKTFTTYLKSQRNQGTIVHSKYFFQNTVRYRHVIKANPSLFKTELLNSHPRLYRINKHIEYLGLEQKLTFLRTQTEQLCKLLQSKLASFPFPHKAKQLLTALQTFLHAKGSDVLLSLQLLKIPTVSTVTTHVGELILLFKTYAAFFAPMFKYLGIGGLVLGSAAGAAEAFMSYQISAKLAPVNIQKALLYQAKGNTEIILTTLTTATSVLAFIPGIGRAMIPLALGIGAAYGLKESRFGTLEKYYTNFYELVGTSKTVAFHQIVETAYGTDSYHQTRSEHRARFSSSVDIEALALTTEGDATKAWLRCDEIEQHPIHYQYVFVEYLSQAEKEKFYTENPDLSEADIHSAALDLKTAVEKRYHCFLRKVGTQQHTEQIYETKYEAPPPGSPSGTPIKRIYTRPGDIKIGPDVVGFLSRYQKAGNTPLQALQQVLYQTRYEEDSITETNEDKDFVAIVTSLSNVNRHRLSFLLAQARLFGHLYAHDIENDPNKELLLRRLKILESTCIAYHIRPRSGITTMYDPLTCKQFLETGQFTHAYGNPAFSEAERLAAFSPIDDVQLEAYYGISSSPIINMARDVATQVFDANDIDLMTLLPESNAGKTGLYVDKEYLRINNMNENDKKFPLHTEKPLATLQEIKNELRESYLENDLIDTASNAGEKTMNAEIGRRIEDIINKYMKLLKQGASADDVIKTYAQQNGLTHERFQLPLDLCMRLYQQGNKNVASSLYKVNKQGNLERYSPLSDRSA